MMRSAGAGQAYLIASAFAVDPIPPGAFSGALARKHS